MDGDSCVTEGDKSLGIKIANVVSNFVIVALWSTTNRDLRGEKKNASIIDGTYEPWKEHRIIASCATSCPYHILTSSVIKF